MDRYPLRKLKQKILTGPEIINHGSEGSEKFEGGTGFPIIWEGTDTKEGTGFIKLQVTDTKKKKKYRIHKTSSYRYKMRYRIHNIKLPMQNEGTGFRKIRGTDTKIKYRIQENKNKGTELARR